MTRRHSEIVSLFDVENTTSPPKVRDLTVSPVSVADVREFAHRYHYTDTGGNMMWRWGLWDGPTLYGVAAYNLPTFSTCETVFGAEHRHRVWHMGRLVCAEQAPRNSESRLIGGSLRAITAEYPHVWAVVTYAAQDVGHLGYIYQATNALYTGTGGRASYHVDRQGRRRVLYLDGKTVDADRAAEWGWTRHTGEVKHRYLYLLGSRSQRRTARRLLRWPVLPYPKVT